MKVAGAVVRGVSMIYATTVGKLAATASVMIAPEADQVNISICPGVSKMTWLVAACQERWKTNAEGMRARRTQVSQRASRRGQELDQISS